jgi:hypothetical protein
MSDHHRIPERPKVEPEIIPPGQPGPSTGGGRWIWFARDDARSFRIETRGPVAVLLALLVLGIVSAVVLALLLGLVLLWIPATLAVAAAILWSMFRRRR